VCSSDLGHDYLLGAARQAGMTIAGEDG
jgi:hypothetical protein